ncbi:FkbM family methyltransferase [Crocosphaera subtropica]|nr:FkbM family methyltransferase [Crocosphaera subtropica]
MSQFLMGIGSGCNVNYSGEKIAFEVLRSKSNAPYCIFDVGANQGQFLHLTLDSLGKDNFKIYCFEPGLRTFEILKQNSRQDERVIVNNLGLAQKKGEMTLYYEKAGSGLASLAKKKLDHFNIYFQLEENVKIETIDNYCHQNSIDKIDLLKLDIEGHELDCLLGAKTMFDRQAIKIVTFEFGGCNIDTRSFFQDFYYFFKDAKMDIFRITPSGYLHPIRCYQEIDEQFRTSNFLACFIDTKKINENNFHYS